MEKSLPFASFLFRVETQKILVDSTFKKEINPSKQTFVAVGVVFSSSREYALDFFLPKTP